MSLIIRYYALMISIFQFVTFNKHVQVFGKFIIYSMFFTPSVSIYIFKLSWIRFAKSYLSLYVSCLRHSLTYILFYGRENDNKIPLVLHINFNIFIYFYLYFNPFLSCTWWNNLVLLFYYLITNNGLSN